MQQIFKISGMTCSGCQASVKKALDQLPNSPKIEVSLEQGLATIVGDQHYSLEQLRRLLPDKYEVTKTQIPENPHEEVKKSTNKWVQLKPLLLIFFYLFSAAILLNIQSWTTPNFMMDFMGLFYIVFSFFKFLDYRGFPGSFSMYDPLSKALPVYGWVYPFIELGLGLMFLFRFEVEVALVMTLIVLGITTYGVSKALFDKRAIRCACLGTALNLPMTEATFIENAIMIVMAVGMLLTL